ncbi:angiopoietin-4-like [Saccostrea echinata]|uniref:angiopoietin-4-like n=1 Tax=Saccostrea echinata TaxID=191078 RepID=UPI002A8265C5|nr:angiopoietin-4-like [Saccostrea echinata]
MWNCFMILGAYCALYCAAEATIKYKEGENVHYVPMTIKPSSQTLLETDIKILKDQIRSLLKQRENDRANIKELERRTIENRDASMKNQKELVQLKAQVSEFLPRLTTMDANIKSVKLELTNLNNLQKQNKLSIKECQAQKDNLKRSIRKLDKKFSPLIRKITEKCGDLSTKLDTFRYEYRNTTEHFVRRLAKAEVKIESKKSQHKSDIYATMKEKYGKRKNYPDLVNTNEVEGSGDIEGEFIKAGDPSSAVVEGSGGGGNTHSPLYLKVKDFITEIYDRDLEISSLHEMFFDMEDHLEKIEERMRSIQLGNFMERLQSSLVNFTQNVITLEQWKIASSDIVNSTQYNQQKIQEVTRMILNNTQHIHELEWKLTNAQTLSYQQFSLLRMHVIQLNNTVQDIKEDLMKRKNKYPSHSTNTKAQVSSPQLKTLSSRVEDLALQIIYNENRISKLEIEALNNSLFECRKFNADIYQDSRLLFLEKSQQRVREDLVKMREITRKLDQGLYKVYLSSKNNTQLISANGAHLNQLRYFLPFIIETHKEMINFRLHLPKDCDEYYRQGSRLSGEYIIHPLYANMSIKVHCDMEEGIGGWTVIQNRFNGSVNFANDWDLYLRGFGRADGEYWLGNQLIYYLTTQKKNSLKIEMTDIHGKLWVANYDTFSIIDDEKFTLSVDGYHGNATDGLGYANRMGFSAIDRDNDGASSHCAMFYMAGWWFKHCHYGNLNGRYDLGMVWYNFDSDEWIQLKTSKMKIIPRN